MIRAARCTSIPTYLGGSSAGSPVWIPTRIRIGPPSSPRHRLAHRGDRRLGGAERVEERVALDSRPRSPRGGRRPRGRSAGARPAPRGSRPCRAPRAARRALDVGEHQRHRPRRLLDRRHLRIVVQRRRPAQRLLRVRRRAASRSARARRTARSRQVSGFRRECRRPRARRPRRSRRRAPREPPPARSLGPRAPRAAGRT